MESVIGPEAPRAGCGVVIRAVLFDFDGVLTTDATGSTTTIGYLARVTGLDAEAWWSAFAPFNDDLLCGRTDHAAAWPSICARLGSQVGLHRLAEAFAATPLNERMFDLARELRAGHACGIVTDNKRDRIDALRERHGLDTLFDPIVVSADCGSGKTGEAIFERALDRLRIAPSQAVFIDNSPRNLVVPARMGLHTVHFDDATNDVDGLRATLRSRFGLLQD